MENFYKFNSGKSNQTYLVFIVNSQEKEKNIICHQRKIIPDYIILNEIY